ncbi:putative restriction endonuclease [Cupriavidus taiwanensis]|uniref:BsuBI/PstI family type II restriction endonuclease n=1 Tax=Cupriavidus taiwanensis TaxID=164546 RepID=UPI000E12DAAE|nr:BsuBI/PstI family type II restriction endonuclease [Cupriavidus taiwanensis]SOZ15595.1 putative restriction endonuclease [Cupriavidus taiwanensis]SOZ27868.1 putative restriction endonuclease [Cupriavidus taiwanensis]SOZ46164.1 putative restriction endonuclease [Cupriavidus taiwanensis]SPA14288.1 putative restriction endonuclease [Cupriavidus taiwanensis]
MKVRPKNKLSASSQASTGFLDVALCSVPSLDIIVERLPLIFPEGTEHRNYVVREMAARTVYVMFYAGAIDGAGEWIRPSQVTDMTDEQATQTDEASRRSWIANSMSIKKVRPSNAWYAPNSREPVRDETIRTGFIPCRAVVERPGIPTTSSKPKYALNAEFAALFNPELRDEKLSETIAAWQESHLSKAAMSRLRLMKHGATVAKDAVSVTFPNGEIRSLAPGPSSVIAKAVIEVFAPRFLKQPAVLWLSESGNKVVARDEALANALGLAIDASKALPDIILVDLGSDAGGTDMLVVFTEVVASDGPINRERKIALTAMALEAGFDERHLAFLTAYLDRSGQPFRKSISELAWGSYAWCASEPEHLMELWASTARKLPSGTA